MMPTSRTIKSEIGRLRKLIEDDSTDPTERRLHQVAEDALRWSTEDTGWPPPSKSNASMATIIIDAAANRHAELVTGFRISSGDPTKTKE